MLAFYKKRAMQNIEQVTRSSYQRTFDLGTSNGAYRLSQSQHNTRALKLEVSLDDFSDLQKLLGHIRRQFDLDVDTQAIEAYLEDQGLPIATPGIRIPGIGNPFEAGVRAILGQQISVQAAINHLNAVTDRYSLPLANLHPSFAATSQLFPSAETLANADLSFLKMPKSRIETLTRFSQFVATEGVKQVDDWLGIKGIGPWTVGYVKLRGTNEPDCFLESDLVVKNALATLRKPPTARQVSPWGSYATFHLWQLKTD
jgi:AraC family transcriptional regulator of adaptative response / DNA-3-methyladenine glycosylase II